MKKKILILSCKIGQGHMSPAQATEQALKKLFPKKYQIEIIDFFELVNKNINNITKKALYGSIKHAPQIYKILYKQFDKKTQIKLLNIIQYPLVYKKIQNFLKKKDPDLILSVYPIWDYNILKISRKNKSTPKFISLITDSIEVHHAWITADADFHIVANTDTEKRIKKMGVEKNKIKTLGLPVRLQFSEKVDKTEVLKKLKLPTTKPLILFIPTAENNKRLIKQVNEIIENHSDKNLVIITGNNEHAFKELKKLQLPKNIRLFAFKKDIHKLIKTADTIISKAGGSIVQECIACQTPIIVTQVIPGHEEGNAILIRKNKLGIDTTNSNISLSSAITKILKNKKTYKENLRKLSRPKAALEVAKFLDSLI